jgi:transcriptional regulator with XRE-family HTH domain
MASDCGMTVLLRRNQKEMFRIAKHAHGWSQAAIHHATGMSETSIGEYARGETGMSGEAILKLASTRDFPSSLLSLLFADTGRHVADDKRDDSDLDDLADAADEVATSVRKARHPHSPGGVNIVPIEREQIVDKAKRFGATAQAATA